MGRKKKLCPDQDKLYDYLTGYTDRELSGLWGVTVQSVAAWRKRYGLEPNKKI